MIINILRKKLSARKLKELQYDNGLFAASSKQVATGYNAAWIRDNIYEALGLEQMKEVEALKKTYHALFDIFRKYEWKLDLALKKKPEFSFQYIHPRYNPESMSEFSEPWGNKQNDAIGAF
ncbi:glycoside hydrolase family 15, partial [Candidatus Woesearchaeota archaeon]|nr:glycoside hydrolase family 15 [Candidatus Woesearchaeota archaeon]